MWSLMTLAPVKAAPITGPVNWANYYSNFDRYPKIYCYVMFMHFI